MPLEAQTRLLRVLQEGEYTTVGGRTPIKTDVRIIAATHRDLQTQIQQGLFREDLFYRLNVVPLRIPPLRERLEDVGDLVRHFLRQAAQGGSRPQVDRDGRHRAPEALSIGPATSANSRTWCAASPRCIPQDTLTAEIVEAELAEAAPRCRPSDSGKTPKDLSEQVERYLAGHFAGYRPGAAAAGALRPVILQHVERPLLMAALAATRGNQIRAAALLGLNRNTLRKTIRDLDIRCSARRKARTRGFLLFKSKVIRLGGLR